jgi:hypothetical protein
LQLIRVGKQLCAPAPDTSDAGCSPDTYISDYPSVLDTVDIIPQGRLFVKSLQAFLLVGAGIP